MLTNDALAVYGGVTTAISVFGPPASPGQALCYAVFGTWAGISGSGGAGNGNRTHLWPGTNYSTFNIDSTNNLAYSMYEGEVSKSFAYLGSVHNSVLNEWAIDPPTTDFDSSQANLEFLNENIDSHLRNAGYSSCAGRNFPEFEVYGDTLTLIGLRSTIGSFTNIETVYSRIDSLISGNTNHSQSLLYFKDLLEDVYDNIEDLQYVSEKLKQELNRINNNYYEFDTENFVISVSMMNVIVYSYHYWNSFINN